MIKQFFLKIEVFENSLRLISITRYNLSVILKNYIINDGIYRVDKGFFKLKFKYQATNDYSVVISRLILEFELNFTPNPKLPLSHPLFFQAQ